MGAASLALTRPGPIERWYRPLAVGLTATILGALAVKWMLWTQANAGIVGADYRGYLVGVRQWLDTGSPYDARTLAGPYTEFPVGVYLHPPIALPLMAPFLVLPAILWWAIPLGLVGWAIASWRPPAWSWPLIALGPCWPYTIGTVMVGNSTIWVFAAVALGLRSGWPAALILVKPTLLPLALIGARKRSWWLASAALGLVGLLMLPLWSQWITAVRNAPTGLAYNSIEGVGVYFAILVAWGAPRLVRQPTMLVPVVTWLARR